MGNTNQTPTVERHQTRADQVVAMARRHADEIRAAAEEDAARVLIEAEREAARRHEERIRQVEVLRVTAEQEAQRVLLEAEREAARRREERLEAERRERGRLSINKRQIEESLDATAAAIARIRELVAVLPAGESSQPTEMMEEGPIPAAPAQPIVEGADRRSRIMNGVAVVLAVWAVLMIVMLAVLPRGSEPAETTGTVAARTAAADVVHAASSPVTPPVVPAVTPAPAGRINVASQRPSDDLGLVVAFVAARDCWITIATDDGTSNERLLKASERYVVRARDVVSFKAGNAGALSVLINERPIAPLGGEGRVVARRITRENYLSFLAS